MSDNHQNDRVLIRMGARELNEQELQKITGACCRFTRASQVPTGTVSAPDVGYDS
ncbi:MAG TPA: hypothetical protein VFY05_11080 [Candidatus Angelobacter sp.]|nr:hypothetical protein [Candidatus Angelobacter sp.]